MFRRFELPGRGNGGFGQFTESELSDREFPLCPDVRKYEIITKIDRGTFGEVYKARHKKNRSIVALKKILVENKSEGFPITAIQEIKVLNSINHENVVKLLEMCHSKGTRFDGFIGSFYMVLEFCEHDLASLIGNPSLTFSEGEIKMVLQQMFNGLYFIHNKKILHRDMKASNILVTKEGTLKLADFSLSRKYTEEGNLNLADSSLSSIYTELGLNRKNCYTTRVVTLWYRPPELLLGETNYGPSIDLWGAGCTMAEMWTRSPIMQGESESHQLNLISQLCGSITPECWPGVVELKTYKSIKLPEGLERKVHEKLRPIVKCCLAVDLLEKLLTLDPSKRIDSHTALDHDYFRTDPFPSKLDKMISMHQQSMFNCLTTSSSESGPQHGPGQ